MHVPNSGGSAGSVPRGPGASCPRGTVPPGARQGQELLIFATPPFFPQFPPPPPSQHPVSLLLPSKLSKAAGAATLPPLAPLGGLLSAAPWAGTGVLIQQV